MIVIYRTQYIPATDTKGVRFKVTCINTGRIKIVPFAYQSNNPIRHSIHEAFGDDVANHIMRSAASRGTAVHHMCEDFLNNVEVTQEGRDFLPWCLFTQIKVTLESSINNIYAQECGLWSEKYRVAGRVDCIAEYNGVPSIIDFKTSRSTRKDDYNLEYYIQASAYAEMFEERTGIAIEQIVILVVAEDGTVQEFIKTKHDYLPLLIETIDDFTEQWEKENEETIDRGVVTAA